MSKIQLPGLHGNQHLPDGSDPIPRLLVGDAGSSWVDLVTDISLTAWWRLGDTFTFASSVSNAAVDSAVFDANSPRSLDYVEVASTGRPTLSYANPNLGADDDGSVLFPGNSTDLARFQKSTAVSAWDVTKIGTTGDQARSWICWFKTPASMPISAGYTSPLLGRWGMDITGSYDLGWIVEIDRSTNRLRWRIKDNTPTEVALQTIVLTAGTWYAAAGTYDGTTYRLYLGGALADSVTSAVVAVDPAAPMFQIGVATYELGLGNITYPHAGAVDEVALYKRVLAIGEIETLAAGSVPASTGFVDSISAAGETPLTGDVTLSEGTNVTLTQTGQNIEVAAAAAAAFDPATATTWWFPLVDSDGTCVLDGSGNLIPTLVPF